MVAVRQEITVRDGVTISFLVLSGADPAVVIVHGLAGSGREFLPTAHALAGRKVVLIDQRGHGHSTRVPADTSRAAFVNDIVRVIEAEELGSVDLVGQSMGAHTAMLVAATRSDLVRRLVLLEGDEGDEGGEGGISADGPDAIGEFFRSWPVPFATREEARAALGDGPLAEAWVTDLEEREDGFHPRFDPEVMVSIITAVATPRWAEWESVTAPTLVVYADHGMFTEAQKTKFVGRGRNAARVDLTDASHDAHLDAFEQWIRELTTFLQ